MQKVLIVEDNAIIQDGWRMLLESRVEVLSALSENEALDLFEAHLGDIALIVMDACVPGNTPTTPWLVERIIRPHFKGPILAASSEKDYRALLRQAGCDYECEKSDVPEKVFEILGLSPAPD